MSKTNNTVSTDTQLRRPKVTVLLPTYNGVNFLRDQINSILNQQNVDVEMIIADDCSSDTTFEMLNEIAQTDERIKIYRNDVNLGLIKTLSFLLRQVTEGYFALSDQDDIWDEDKLEQSVQVLENTGAALAYSDVRLIDTQGRTITEHYLRKKKIRPYAGCNPNPFIFHNPAIGHTLVGTAKLAQSIGEIDDRLRTHEIWIISKACRIGHIAYLDMALGGYRQHNSNLMGARKSVIQRLISYLSLNGRLASRQQTRARAIHVLAQDWPDLQPIAGLLTRRGVRRLIGWPNFILFIISLRNHLPAQTMIAEIVFYPLSVGQFPEET